MAADDSETKEGTAMEVMTNSNYLLTENNKKTVLKEFFIMEVMATLAIILASF